jgi:ABC-type dipeptide/oligopeptide/nickel transport system permease component
MRLVLTRFAQMLFVLWVVATLLFFMFRLMPGDPTVAYITTHVHRGRVSNSGEHRARPKATNIM